MRQPPQGVIAPHSPLHKIRRSPNERQHYTRIMRSPYPHKDKPKRIIHV